MIYVIIKDEPAKLETQMQELSKYRPEVIEAVLDNLPDISDKDKDTLEESISKLQELDIKTQDAGLIAIEKVTECFQQINTQTDPSAFMKLNNLTSTLVMLRNGFFKQGTVVQVAGTISNNNLTLIKNGGRV